jgi:hypothetical protein
VRQLQGSLAWDIVRARHRLGATLAFASAATVSIGAWAIPVYEIYKVGEDVHSKAGLNFFSDFGMHLSFVPHWNNTDGGEDVDTSRCFIGMERFNVWCHSLPAENTTVGLDEHTGLIVDFETGQCEVSGVSSVSLVHDCEPKMYPAGAKFGFSELGSLNLPEPIEAGIPAEVWEMVNNVPPLEENNPSADVLALTEQRLQARASKNWSESDRLRDQIAALGWTVQDTKDGQKLVKG